MHNLCMKTPINDDLLLDTFDLKLLTALQNNALATNQELGDLVHLSGSQVSRRVQRLHANGLIRQYTALLDAQLLGLTVRAITAVSLLRHGGDEGRAFEAAIQDMPEVLACDSVTGEADYILQIVAANLADLSDSVLRRLTALEGVSSIRSNLVLQRIKSSTELPLQHLSRNSGQARVAKLVS